MKLLFFTQNYRPWFLYLSLIYLTWGFLLFSGPGLSHYIENWSIALVMIFGSAVAGFTPEGGGAIAYPILSIWFGFPNTIARDFSLAIQAIGMTSASIYILSSRRREWSFYRLIPVYVIFNMIGFIVGISVFGSSSNKIIQMIFVSLALAFITALWSIRKFGTADDFELNSSLKWITVGIMCFLGGLASSMFGTGADMLLYVCLSCWFAMKEKEATDLSIIVMAFVSIFGILTRILVTGGIDPQVYDLWLAAIPVVLLGAPLGNWLLQSIRKESMLIFLFFFNLWTFIWWSYNNTSLILIALLLLILIYLIMICVMYQRRTNLYDKTSTR